MDEALALMAQLATAADQRNAEVRALQEYGIDRILEQQTPRCPNIVDVTPEIREQLHWLLKFFKYNPYLRLAGLAANQVSIKGERLMLNACVIMRANGAPLLAVNPHIKMAMAPTFQSKEGCLTWPGKVVHATRFSELDVEYTDTLGVCCSHRVQGFEAIVWQHELSHLQGVVEDVRCPVQKQAPNDPCACKSGKKWKKCCGR